MEGALEAKATAPLAVRAAAWGAVLLAVSSLGLGLFARPSPEEIQATPLPRASPAEPAITGEGFVIDGGLVLNVPSVFPQALPTFGSFQDEGRSKGEVRSATYLAEDDFFVGVFGYPNGGNLSVATDLACEGGRRARVEVNPCTVYGETAYAYPITVSAADGRCTVQVVARDDGAGPEDWVAFTPPFSVRADLGGQLLAVVRTVCFLGLLLVLILGPGLAMRARITAAQRADLFGFVALPGILLLAVLGMLAWKWKGLKIAFETPQNICAALAAVVVVAVGLELFRRGPQLLRFDATERAVLMCVVLLAVVGAFRPAYSPGVVGELFGGTVSRSLEVGDRSDNRIPYSMVQLVARREGARSGYASMLFWPYAFSSRGPLAGLAAAVPTLSTGAVPSPVLPQESWQPFDAQGFAAFRMTMVVMSACFVLAVFGFALSVKGRAAARIVVAIAAMTPFLVHELYFTWPKILAACGVVWALHALHRGLPVAAGLLLGIGYLFHPLALFSIPTFGALSLWLNRRVEWPPRRAVLLIAGLAVPVAAWWFVNRGAFHQGQFVDYLMRGNHELVGSVSAWAKARLVSVANTLVPAYLFFFHSADPWVNQYHHRSPAVVHWFFQYWTTLPFGLGLVTVPLVSAWTWRGARAQLLAFLVIVASPFLGFAVYWGSFWSGLMREGLHPWVMTLLLFAVLASGATVRSAPWVRFWFAARAVELLAMLLLPAMATAPVWINPRFALSDALSLLAVVMAVVLLARNCARLFSAGASGDVLTITESTGEKDEQHR